MAPSISTLKSDYAMIGFGMNCMGSHFNAVSLNIVDSESYEEIKIPFVHRVVRYVSDSKKSFSGKDSVRVHAAP
jgi:hypothetical protein